MVQSLVSTSGNDRNYKFQNAQGGSSDYEILRKKYSTIDPT
jgi:hypothetical protein